MQDPAGTPARRIVPLIVMVLLALVVSTGCSGGHSSSLLPPPPAPNLTIGVSHSGKFQLGQPGGIYTINIKNNGPGDTNGTTVTVTEFLPAGIVLSSMVGTGWSCQSNACTRNDVLPAGASYPAIIATVTVGADTVLDSTNRVINQVSVSGGNSTSAKVSDQTPIDPGPPSALSVTMTHIGAFSAGQDFAPYAVIVSNASTAQAATIGIVDVAENLPLGENESVWGSPVGTGWNCPDNAECWRDDPLPPGQSYSPLTLFVRVGQNPSSPQVNTVTVTAPNSPTASTTDSTVIGGTTLAQAGQAAMSRL